MRGVAGIALVACACSFDSGGQASSTSIGAGTESETSSASSDPVTSTLEETGGPSSATAEDTMEQPSDDSSESSAGPLESTTTTTDAETTTSATELESSTTSEPVAELCNGVDDDGDGAVDEYSPRNTSCGSCVYEITPTGVVQSYCTDQVTWDEAVQRCVDLGASLATLHDAAANDEVFATTAGDNAWIGLSDTERENDWEWLDGSAMDFLAWEPGQPNDLGDEDCGHMRDAGPTWNDDECTNPHSYVCRGPQ